MKKLNLFCVTITDGNAIKQHFVISERKNLNRNFLLNVLGLNKNDQYFLKKIDRISFYTDVVTTEGYLLAQQFKNTIN